MQCNIKNRTLFCHDNLDILNNINSACIDLIYLDPPFNKKKVFTASIGSDAEGAEFKDIFKQEDVQTEWVISIKEDNPALHELLDFTNRAEGNKSYNFCYLSYMAIRLIECQRILKDTGSIYLHCDPTMSHYLKLALDCIFGERNFRNEITWKRYAVHSLSGKKFDDIADIILYYGNSDKVTFIKQYEYSTQTEIQNRFPHYEKETQRFYQHIALEQASNYKKGDEARVIAGKKITTSIGWRWSQNTFDTRISQNPHLIYWTRNGRPRYKKYMDDYEGSPLGNIWTDIQYLSAGDKERKGYPTQKPLALLERIIKASSHQGGIVLDPFCGCATTCVAAERLERQWIGIDVSLKARDLIKIRLDKEAEAGRLSADLLDYDQELDWDKLMIFSIKRPTRTDLGEQDLEEKKYVYIISHANFKGEYKVGIAKDWQSRLNSYQTSDPERAYKMEYYLLTTKFREIEKHIHTTFPNKHEWVAAKLDLIKKEIQEANNFIDQNIANI